MRSHHLIQMLVQKKLKADLAIGDASKIETVIQFQALAELKVVA